MFSIFGIGRRLDYSRKFLPMKASRALYEKDQLSFAVGEIPFIECCPELWVKAVKDTLVPVWLAVSCENSGK